MHLLSEACIDQEPRLPRRAALLIYLALALLVWAGVIVAARLLWALLS